MIQVWLLISWCPLGTWKLPLCMASNSLAIHRYKGPFKRQALPTSNISLFLSFFWRGRSLCLSPFKFCLYGVFCHQSQRSLSHCTITMVPWETQQALLCSWGELEVLEPFNVVTFPTGDCCNSISNTGKNRSKDRSLPHLWPCFHEWGFTSRLAYKLHSGTHYWAPTLSGTRSPLTPAFALYRLQRQPVPIMFSSLLVSGMLEAIGLGSSLPHSQKMRYPSDIKPHSRLLVPYILSVIWKLGVQPLFFSSFFCLSFPTATFIELWLTVGSICWGGFLSTSCVNGVATQRWFWLFQIYVLDILCVCLVIWVCLKFAYCLETPEQVPPSLRAGQII